VKCQLYSNAFREFSGAAHDTRPARVVIVTDKKATRLKQFPKPEGISQHRLILMGSIKVN
jgi:hypothetical protein